MATRTINSRNYPATETVVDFSQNIANRFSAWEITFTRESWPIGLDCTLSDGTVLSNTAMQIIVEKSLDNGTTWTLVSGSTFPGGDAFDSKGNLYSTSALIVELKGTETSKLRARIRTFVPLRTAITANVVDA